MAGSNAFEVEGEIAQALPNKLYLVRLANGHVLKAYLTGRSRLSAPAMAMGDRVKVQMSPHDLSEGRIVLESKKV